jgi:peptide/nickel transport system permease protein
MGLEPHVVSNGVILVLVAGLLAIVSTVRRSALWRRSFRDIARRAPVSILVVALYVAVAGLESVSWVDSEPLAEGAAAKLPRSVVDRLFPFNFQERSYSAPLESAEFYGGAPLRHPGRHLLGTDKIGRDVLHQRVSAGYLGGRFDDVVFFIMSTLASMPSLLLLIALIAALGHGTVQVCVALGVTSWVGMCRLSRAETLKLRELDYVKAARALGVSDFRILVRHILPNLMHLVIITFVLMFSGLVLAEAVLSWLGIGLQGSWGQMIDQARDELSREPVVWWNLVAAATALFVLILAVNRIGDAVRDVLDPRTAPETP